MIRNVLDNRLFILILLFFGIYPIFAQPLQTGNPAPGIFLRDLDGDDFFLSDYCGKPRQPWKNPQRFVVVLSFFATYCIPCRQEIPELATVAQKFGDPVKIFLIDLKEQDSLVREYVKQNGFQLPVLLDNFGVTARKYAVETLPKLFVIDQTGILRYVQEGYGEENRNILQEKIDALLKNRCIENKPQ
jgi:cytochrome c biogenesis protein CcmG, thiol:disulfide interchange protein DsbE